MLKKSKSLFAAIAVVGVAAMLLMAGVTGQAVSGAKLYEIQLVGSWVLGSRVIGCSSCFDDAVHHRAVQHAGLIR
jgi:hypothetical protein